MTVVILGIGSLDPDLVDPDRHPNLTLESYHPIGTPNSADKEPKTHEIWPSIITGKQPQKHGIVSDDDLPSDSSRTSEPDIVLNRYLPNILQTYINNWLVTAEKSRPLQTPASYYENNDIPTLFDNHKSTTIGIPNYVTNPEESDREDQLREQMRETFLQKSDNPDEDQPSVPIDFYNQCLEMTLVRITRMRRAVRSNNYELIFGYTSGIDLIHYTKQSHMDYQQRSYNEINEFVGQLREDLDDDDVLVIVSDHGEQTDDKKGKAMIAGPTNITEKIEHVTDIKGVVEQVLESEYHQPDEQDRNQTNTDRNQTNTEGSDEVKQQLEDVGYL